MRTRRPLTSGVLALVALIGLAALASCGGDDRSAGTDAKTRSGSTRAQPAPTPDPADSAAPAPSAASGPSAANAPSAGDAADCYVDAVNAEDLDGLVDCFDRGAVVVDVSRRIEGREAIREWAEREVIGGSLRVLDREPRPDGLRLLVHWAPAGSDGWQAYYTFDATGGRITVADLQYA